MPEEAEQHGAGFDLSSMQGEVPDWLKWIAENKDSILAVMAGVTAGLTGWKLGLTALQSFKLGVAITGIVYAVEKLIDFMNDPTFENFGGTIQGVGVAILGIFSGLPAIIAGVVVIIYGTIVRYWESIQSFFQSKINWLKEKGDGIRNFFGDTAGNIYDDVVQALQSILDFFDAMFISIKGQFEGLIQFFQGVFTGDWNKAWDGLKKGYEAWYQGITQMFQKFKEYLNFNIIKPMGDFFDGIVQLMVSAGQSIWKFITQTFTESVEFIKNTWSNIKSFFTNIGYTVGESISSAFKSVINAVLSAAERILNSPIRSINSLIGVINAVPGINLGYLSTMWFPRLATGGIVNYPNRGIGIGGAIAGESGAEGVIPLTDSQAMETLGQAIGKYITINANIVNSMNGRILSREIKRISGQQAYASNL